MQLSINYSPQAADLLHSGRITLDCFKCPNWPDLVATVQEQHAVYVHFDLRAGPGTTAATDWQHVETLLEQTGTPYVNIHLSPRVTELADMPIDTTDPRHTDMVLERLIQDIAPLVEHFGPERVIAENVPYDGPYSIVPRPAADPAVIGQVLAETGCGLLLDISHARIAAHYMGIDEYDYLARLPGERLRELHLTGLKYIDGRLEDHYPMTPTDWPALEWVLQRVAGGEWAHPWGLAFEYGGVGGVFRHRSDAGVIAEQIPRLYEAVHAIPC